MTLPSERFSNGCTQSSPEPMYKSWSVSHQLCHLSHEATHPSTNPSLRTSLGSELELHLRNSRRRVEALGARTRAVENGVAPVQAQLVLHLFLAVRGVGVLQSRTALAPMRRTSLHNTTYPRVCHPAVGGHERRRTEVLILVPPVTRARRRAAGAEDALVHATNTEG